MKSSDILPAINPTCGMLSPRSERCRVHVRTVPHDLDTQTHTKQKMTISNSLTAQQYESQAALTDRRADGGSAALPLLGLFGETGSLLMSYIGYKDAVVEELGDVLWYITNYAARVGLSLSVITDRLANGPPPKGRPVESLPLARLQHPTLPLLDSPTPAFERTLLQLASAVGALVADHVGASSSDVEISPAERLEKILSLLVTAANEAGVTIENAAIHNIAKILDRWPITRTYPPLFDAEDDQQEQLPRHLVIEVAERNVAGHTYVFQRCNDINIGDRLTDNSPASDDYRFHDVFHYAYAAVLGWSPVVRALFRVKRKSRPQIDEAEDSARPALIEEGIAAWIFSEAEPLKYFEGLKEGDLAFSLLKRVRQFVGKYEAGRCPLWLWEEAILQGFGAFRFLHVNRRARLEMDLTNRRLTVGPLSS
jgi:hypothetical protein